ncbi:MAG: long-chain fatty acid--CoA ligase [Alphaproteobacteria bacterium]|nr:long-chain fatty acid--CoA ligase [Alphaproteobacteria bacterium]
MKSLSTLLDLISFQAANFNNPRALNFKEGNAWVSFSNQEFQEKILHFACGLREIGLQKGEVFANNSYQNPIWLIADLGAILAGGITVPIFQNISPEHLRYEISDSKAKFIFNEKREVEILESRKLISFEDLISLGAKAVGKYEFKAEAGDLATIIYTSGSIGMPKGVELTHQNLISQIKGTAKIFPLEASDVALSFLPLAHIFERMVMLFYISQGISVYFADDVKNVGNLLREVRPTLMTAVPRVLEKTFAKIKDGVESANPVKKLLGRRAIIAALDKGSKAFDFLVYKKFRAALGGRMQMIICGGAALMPDLERFYNNIGVNLFCGYGLTEASPVIAANCPTAHKLTTVGKAFPGVEIKIAEDGELLARGANLMRGYHNQPEKTAATIKDGWLHTGDLASIDADGFVKITGRKKELFKTANGKYVSPVPLEQKLVQELGFLLGAIVIAEGRRFTSALLFPEFETLPKLKKEFSFTGSDQEFLTSEILQKFVQQKVDSINLKLDHWEQIQKFQIITESISIGSGEITPSMKLKRSLLEKKCEREIAEIYSTS